MERPLIMEAVQQQSPLLLPWASFCLESEALLICGDATIKSRRGVQQGDPLGPMWFCMGLKLATQDMRASKDWDWESWFMDDGQYAGSLPQLEHVLASL